ncbi:MAG TPA: T9SS type A sorting domain-containing protein [Saprospiraceae bacterium]|nr:T9SS type A sorting domain-containing protein [Saprospiraceae bacterium]
MKSILTFLFAFIFVSAFCQTPFISEINYDNPGGDNNEYVEVFYPTGIDPLDYVLTRYNGAGGAAYTSPAQTGSTCSPATGGQVCVYTYAKEGLQHGSPDGIALSTGTTLIEFISYEGTFTAVGGIADGILSSNTGVQESNAENPDLSLQRNSANGVWVKDALSNGILPIKLGTYKIQINQSSIGTIWSTTEETNNSHFTIDHSKDGINFIEVGRVEAKQERSGEKDYSFAHESPAKGINYYRLNQFDLDGKKTSFGILAGNFEGGKEQFLFPTSAVNEVWLSGYESAPVKIFDASGKELINELYQTGNSIDVSNLQSGVYFLLIGQDRLSFLKH